MLMVATIGCVTVMGGLFYYNVCDELGFDLSKFTLYVTLSMVFMALGMPVCGKILSSGKIKLPVLLTVALLMELIPFALMSTFNEMWQWFVAALPIGLGLSATSTVTAAPTLGNWFHKKTGFAIGMIFTMQSIFVAIMSPVFANMIATIGWRTSYVALAAIALVLALPFTIFVIRYRPEDKGMLPYGYDPAEVAEDGTVAPAKGVSFKVAIKSVPFFMLCIVVMMAMMTSNMNVVLPTYAEVVGLGALVGGLMVTCASVADIFLNPIIGSFCDKFGATRSMIVWTGVTIVSLGILYLSANSPILAYIGAALNDAMYAYDVGGYARISTIVNDNVFVVTFMDRGRPYNPLEREDPDITLSAEQRNIGGLGVFMIKKVSDAVNYSYENGQNILQIAFKID